MGLGVRAMVLKKLNKQFNSAFGGSANFLLKLCYCYCGSKTNFRNEIYHKFSQKLILHDCNNNLSILIRPRHETNNEHATNTDSEYCSPLFVRPMFALCIPRTHHLSSLFLF